MSEAAILLDPYISILGDVTPSNVHRLDSESPLRPQSNELCRFRDFTLQEEAGPHQRFRWTNVPMSTRSENANDVLRKAIRVTWQSPSVKFAQLLGMPSVRQASLRPENDWEAADLDMLRAYCVALTRLRSAN